MSDKSNQETCPGCKRKRCCECYKTSSNEDLAKMVGEVIREHGNYTKSGCCGAKILILPSPHGSDFNVHICRKCTKECFGRECEQLWVIPKTDPNASVSASKVINLLSKPAPWQERFDEKFPDGAWSDPDSLAINISDKIKSFIASLLKEREDAAFKRGEKSMGEKLYKTWKDGNL